MFALYVMFGVAFGHQSTRIIRSKLGGNFLGYIKLGRGLPLSTNQLSANQVGVKQLYTNRAVKKRSSSKQVRTKPCHSQQDDMKQLYRLLRDVQDQVATFFGHPVIPSRYLAIYVGETRLTSKSFPFIDEDNLITQESVGATILKLLDGALYIDVMYDEDTEYAEANMTRMGLEYFFDAHVGNLHLASCKFEPHVDALPAELEVFNFCGAVRRIETVYSAYELGKGLLKFPCLETLKVDGVVQEVDFAGLAQIKTLSELDLSTKTLDASFCSLTNLKRLCLACNGRTGSSLPTELGLMTNLRFLKMSGKIKGSIPTELGMLSKLDELSLCGDPWANTIKGSIPTELGLMTNLDSLFLKGHFSGRIPTELGLLHRLQELWIVSPFLESNVPSQLCGLSRLEYLMLYCKLQGCLPDEINKLTRLEYLVLVPSLDTTCLDKHTWTQTSNGEWKTLTRDRQSKV